MGTKNVIELYCESVLNEMVYTRTYTHYTNPLRNFIHHNKEELFKKAKKVYFRAFPMGLGIKWRWKALLKLAKLTRLAFNYVVPPEFNIMVLMALGVMGKHAWDKYHILYHAFRECDTKHPAHIDSIKNKRCREQYAIQMANIFKSYKNKCAEIENKREQKKCNRTIDRSIHMWEKQITKYARY